MWLWRIPLSLLVGPKVLPAGSSYYANTDPINDAVPSHPFKVDTYEDASYDEYYVVGCYS